MFCNKWKNEVEELDYINNELKERIERFEERVDFLEKQLSLYIHNDIIEDKMNSEVFDVDGGYLYYKQGSKRIRTYYHYHPDYGTFIGNAVQGVTHLLKGWYKKNEGTFKLHSAERIKKNGKHK
jgi:hypothetical protein